MAKVQLGSTLADIRGSIGSNTYSRNHQGIFIRTRKTPANPRTILQVYLRSLLKGAGGWWWSALTPTQRAEWTAKAAQTRVTNTLAMRYNQTPSNLWTSRTMNLELSGNPYISDPVPDVANIDPGSLTLTGSSGAQTLTLNPTTSPPAGWTPIVRATPSMSPGWANLNAYYRILIFRQLQVFSDNFGGTHPVGPWTAQFGYTAANWNNAANILTTSSVPGPQFISAGITQANARFKIQFAITNTATNAMLCGIGMQTATGEGFYLSYTGATTTLSLALWSTWTSGPVITYATYPDSALGTASHQLQIDVYQNFITVTLDNKTIMSVNPGFNLPGDIALCLKTTSTKFQNCTIYSLTPQQMALPNIQAWWITSNGPLVAGKQVGVLLRYINNSTGQATAPRTAACIVS